MARKPVKPPSADPLYSRADLLDAMELSSRLIPEKVKPCLYCHFEADVEDCWHLPKDIRLRIWKHLADEWSSAPR